MILGIIAGYVMMLLGFRQYVTPGPLKLFPAAVLLLGGMVLTFGGILLYCVPDFFN